MTGGQEPGPRGDDPQQPQASGRPPCSACCCPGSYGHRHGKASLSQVAPWRPWPPPATANITPATRRTPGPAASSEGHGDLGFADHLVCRENSARTVMSGLTEAWASGLLQTEVVVTSHSARPGAENRGTHLMSHWHTAAKGPRDLQLSHGGNMPLGMRASPRLGLGT